MFDFTITKRHQDCSARSGQFTTPHGVIHTPCFMPVGTKGAVKGISPQTLKNMDAEVMLANTYHLMLRPGEDHIHHMGGIHRWISYGRPMLTDSGGFQIFSLGLGNKKDGSSLIKITDDGVKFQSYLTGQWRYITPEDATMIQHKIGADIMMAFDECAPGDASHDYAKQAMHRTHHWLGRCIDQWNTLDKKTSHGLDQALFGICQGGIFDDLRKESAQYIASRKELTGCAIGGLSVGESLDDMRRSLSAAIEHLPEDKPRYFMGLGTPKEIQMAIEMGVDMFDCVLPTRLGRHGAFFCEGERLNIRNEQFKNDTNPLDPNMTPDHLQQFSRSYIRHLVIENEMLGMMILSEHNLHYLIELCRSYC